jgi:hypothetical protein
MLRRFIVSAASVTWLVCNPVAADDLDQQKRALGVIQETAAAICLTIPPHGAKQYLEASGEVKAKLGGAAAKVFDLGIAGAGKYIDEQWTGVLQQELAQSFKDNANCRLEVFRTLQNKMLGSSAPQRSQRDQPDRIASPCASQIGDGNACIAGNVGGSISIDVRK